MLENIKIVSFYRSFSENSSNNAWNQNFNSGNQNNNNKNNHNNRVRLCSQIEKSNSRMRNFMFLIFYLLKIMTKISIESLYDAYLDCNKHKSNTQSAIKFEPSYLRELTYLKKEIDNRTYHPSKSSCFLVESSTLREVFAASYRDRIIHHWIYIRMNPIIEKSLIYDTASCRVGKGTDFALKRIRTFIRRLQNQSKKEIFYLKLDISGFFMSIDRELLLSQILELINRFYFEEDKDVLIYLVTQIILNDPTKDCIFKTPKSEWEKLPDRKTLFKSGNKGIPIGNLTSQIFSNYYLNKVDRLYLKHKSCYYERYVDDIIILSHDKEELNNYKKDIIIELKKVGCNISYKKTHIASIRRSFHFLGKIIHPFYTTVEPKLINRMFSENYNKENLLNSLNSRVGQFKYYNGFHTLERFSKLIKNKFSNYIFEDFKFRELECA